MVWNSSYDVHIINEIKSGAMKTKEITICQSCGMPMREEPQFGTNLDGTLNLEYCHYCFQEGEFTDAGITMEEKIQKNVEFAKQMGMTEEQAFSLARTIIPKLKRWQ